MPSKCSQSGDASRAFFDRGFLNFLKMVAVGALVTALICLGFRFFPITAGMTLLALALLFVAHRMATNFLDPKIDAIRPREKPAVRNSVTAEEIGRVLSGLGGEQILLRDVRCQFGSIDYVVLSRAYGVCIVEIKHDEGHLAVVDSRIRLGGKLPETDYISGSLHNTYWLLEELQAITGMKVSVTSLIVFTSAQLESSRTIKGVTLTNQRFLRESVCTQAAPMAAELWAAREKVAAVLAGKES